MNIHTVRGIMDEMLQALLLFWLPVAVVPFGVWIFLSSSNDQRKTFGRFLAFVGIVMVCTSPWTVPSSPSTAAGHLLGAIIGPAVLILLGIYLISFSGHVPVGRLPRSDRKLGMFLSFVGFAWFAGMHWWILTPQIASGQVNDYWFVFWPTFLLLTSCLSSCAAIASLTIGDNRKTESNYMFTFDGEMAVLKEKVTLDMTTVIQHSKQFDMDRGLTKERKAQQSTKSYSRKDPI